MEASRLFHFKAPRGIGIDSLSYPLPVIRLEGKDRKQIAREGSRIIEEWKKTAPGIRTVNLLFYRKEDNIICLIILRDSEHRNPEDLQKYKSEGIGVVEAAGSWIFPPPQGYPEEELIRNSRSIIKGFFQGISPFDPQKIEGYDFLPYHPTK